MQTEKYQELKNKAFQAKTKDQWDAVMEEIKEAVADDKNAATALRNYCKQILPKKKEYWAKYPKKQGFQAAPKMMFSPETDKAIGDLARALTKYFEKKL